MITEQNYVGKGSHANDSEESVKNTPLAVPSADNPNPPFINPRIYQAQTRLLELADQFASLGFEQGPSKAVERLLHHWLSTPAEKLSITDNDDSLHCALLLADCLFELYLVNCSNVFR